MAAAGIAWGVYSLRGRGSREPLRNTAGNFLMAAPVAVLLVPIAGGAGDWTASGVALAVASGALASGVGYAVWYAALPALTATRAALVQLLVPVLAAAGGVALLSEAIPLRLPVAAALVLGGVALAVTARSP
jgi:drug/metabolite transporter (DMT)-like permease